VVVVQRLHYCANSGEATREAHAWCRGRGEGIVEGV
jgi:hypothetical protein